MALGSACEVRYLLGVALRLGMLGQPQHDALEPRYGQLVRRMQKLINSLGGRRSP
jgi:four helix bundle protein